MTDGAVFGELVGQETVVEQLRAAVSAAGTAREGAGLAMTHAWLFTGPPGSGRSAAALLCANQGCGECPSCRQVAAGTHADLLLIRPDGLSYGVKQTRDLVLRAATAPVYGRWRVVLFEDADRATEQAANALLKAIEEPAPRTVWLLCAPSPDDLPTTIRSRCRLVTLCTPRTAAVADVLVRSGGGADPALTAPLDAQAGHRPAGGLAAGGGAASARASLGTPPRRRTGLRALLGGGAGEGGRGGG